jgi:RNA polymerase-binding protein DksA
MANAPQGDPTTQTDNPADRLSGDIVQVPLHADPDLEVAAADGPQADIQPGDTPLSKDDLAFFKDLIEKRKAEATDDIARMKEHLANAREQSENDTAYSFHMADAGTDAMEREKLHLMVARQQKYVGYLDRALERIANGTYGICKVTGKPIGKERLKAVPHTEISIEAKRQQG